MLKSSLILSLLAGFSLVGCDGGGTSQPKPGGSGSSSGNPLTAPVDYLGAAGNAQKSAGKTAVASGVSQAIKLFEAEEGRLPKTLDELAPKYFPTLPAPPVGTKYLYNPVDGSLKVVPK